jgi:hypothetical protein
MALKKRWSAGDLPRGKGGQVDRIVGTVSEETVECLGIQPVSQNVRRPSLEGRSTTSERLCPRNRTRKRLRWAAQTIGPVHCRVRGHRSEVMFPVLAVGIAHGGRPSKMQSWRTCFSGCALRNRIALYRRSRSICFRALLPASSGLPASRGPADCSRRLASTS